MSSKHKTTTKDIILISLFVLLVILNIVYHIKSYGFTSIGVLISQTLILMLSFVGLINMSAHIGWNILVPDFFEFNQKQKRIQETQNYINGYIQADINYIRDYDQERMNYFLSQLGVSTSQLDEIRIGLIQMRCMPLKNLEDAAQKIEHLVTLGFPIIINQDKIDSSRISYNKVKYFINFTDIMFDPNYAREFSSILSFLISEKIDVHSIDKIIVPHDSNFLLGVEVSRKLGIPVVKMRSGRGKIITDQYWEGTLNASDKVIIIHDVLVTADQILETCSKLPDTCHIFGLYCLMVRKEWDGVKRLREKNIPVISVVKVDDADIHKIRGEE